MKSIGPPERNAGFLEVGINNSFEVVVNHPDLKPDKNGVGHIVFSPNQAQKFARLLMKHATEALTEWKKQNKENV